MFYDTWQIFIMSFWCFLTLCLASSLLPFTEQTSITTPIVESRSAPRLHEDNATVSSTENPYPNFTLLAQTSTSEQALPETSVSTFKTTHWEVTSAPGVQTTTLHDLESTASHAPSTTSPPTSPEKTTKGSTMATTHPEHETSVLTDSTPAEEKDEPTSMPEQTSVPMSTTTTFQTATRSTESSTTGQGPESDTISTTFSTKETTFTNLVTTYNSTEDPPSVKTPGLWLAIIAVLAGTACIGGMCFVLMCAKNQRKSRTENFRNSSSKKKGKGVDVDPWAGPVALNGERDWMGRVEEGDNGQKLAGGTEVLLSTFISLQEKEPLEESKEPEEPDNLAKVPEEEGLLQSPPLSSSLPPPHFSGEEDEEKNVTFCLTSAV